VTLQYTSHTPNKILNTDVEDHNKQPMDCDAPAKHAYSIFTPTNM